MVRITRSAFENLADLRLDAAHASILDQQALDARLANRQVGRDLEHALHPRAIGGLVGLRAARAHGRSLARVEEAELDSGLVDGERHLAAERVDLAHQMALADPADRRIARHLADMVEIEREHQRGNAHARRGQRGFDAGVTGTDDDYAKIHRGGDYGAHDASGQAPRGEPLYTNSRETLLSDTELAEHRVEHILGADLAGDRAQGLGGGGRVDRDDLGRHAGERARAARA